MADLWNLVSPFVAAGTAVWLARRQDRERVSCYVDWEYGWDDERGYSYEYLYVGIHNRSAARIVIRSIRILNGSFPRRAQEGTFLNYDDPMDLSFPYSIEPGAILKFAADEAMTRKIMAGMWRITKAANVLLRRPRLMVECVTTAGTRLRGSAEEALPWVERQAWARH